MVARRIRIDATDGFQQQHSQPLRLTDRQSDCVRFLGAMLAHLGDHTKRNSDDVKARYWQIAAERGMAKPEAAPAESLA